jgi:hypothetical protein
MASSKVNTGISYSRIILEGGVILTPTTGAHIYLMNNSDNRDYMYVTSAVDITIGADTTSTDANTVEINLSKVVLFVKNL